MKNIAKLYQLRKLDDNAVNWLTDKHSLNNIHNDNNSKYLLPLNSNVFVIQFHHYHLLCKTIVFFLFRA